MGRSILIFFSMTLFCHLTFSQNEPQAVLTSQEAPRLQGLWKSEVSRSLAPGVYYTQEIQFTLARWERTIFFSGTADMKKTLLISRTEGPFELKKNPDANAPWSLDLKVARRTLNLQQTHAALSKALHLGSCSLTKKKETEIPQGCGAFPALDKCPIEYEIADTKEGQLHIAAPEGSAMNFISSHCDPEKRPKLLDFSLKRIN